MEQLHNRLTTHARLVWNVDRLMRLSEGLPIKAGPLYTFFEFEEVGWLDKRYPATCRAVVAHMHRIQEVGFSY